MAAKPDFGALEAAACKPVAPRRTDVGDVAIRAAWIDGVGCVEGTVAVDVPSDKLLAVTDDMVTAPAWSSTDLTHSEELSRDAGGFVLFQRLDVPAWTLTADRFWVIHGHADRTASRYRWYRVDSGARQPWGVVLPGRPRRHRAALPGLRRLRGPRAGVGAAVGDRAAGTRPHRRPGHRGRPPLSPRA